MLEVFLTLAYFSFFNAAPFTVIDFLDQESVIWVTCFALRFLCGNFAVGRRDMKKSFIFVCLETQQLASLLHSFTVKFNSV